MIRSVLAAAACLLVIVPTWSGELTSHKGVIPRAAPFGDAFWGVAPSAALSYGPGTWVRDMALAGVTSVRGFDATKAEDRLQPILAAGLQASGILWWSSPRNPGTLPVDDLAGWRAYVTSMVRRYRGRVQSWEVWNEPPNFTKDQSPASYGAVVAAAYDAAKAVDPSVRIGLAAKSNHVNFLAQAIAAGAAEKFDFVTLHPYENAALLGEGFEGQFMSIVPRLRTMLREMDPAKADVPVRFSEIGLPVTAGAGPGGPGAQADGLVKIFTMAAAQGVSQVSWFSPRDAEGETLGLFTADGIKRPSYTALRTLAQVLGPHPVALGWLRRDPEIYGFVFEGPRGVVLVAWASDGLVHELMTPSRVETIDLGSGYGGARTTVTVSGTPSIAVARVGSPQGEAWKSEAVASVGTAFPWHGTHRGARFVSFSADVGSNGVYLLDAPPATNLYGRAAYDFEGRSAPRFAVDPEFLSWTTTPIRITVTLRGHAAGDPGFNLKYESSNALSSTDGNGLTTSPEGWHRVDKTRFYEKSWTIANPRLVGLYGYNFILDTDGRSHTQFSVHSVVVTKI